MQARQKYSEENYKTNLAPVVESFFFITINHNVEYKASIFFVFHTQILYTHYFYDQKF